MAESFEEFIMNATPEGKEIAIKAAEVLVHENYTIKSLHLYLDRLEIVQTLAKGPLERFLVNRIHRETVKGLF